MLYHEPDYAETLYGGIDVVLDVLGGGEAFALNLKLLAPKGRMVTLALLAGRQVNADIAPLLAKQLTLYGSTLRSDTADAKASVAKALQEYVWPLYTDGRMKPVVDSVFPLTEVEAAHQHMERRAHTGKLVLCVT